VHPSCLQVPSLLPNLYTINLIHSLDLKTELATFAAGCFWGVEHIFLKHYPPADNKGILKTSVGYTGGNPDIKDPTYNNVCSGETDHAEAVNIEFDPTVVTYAELVGTPPSVFCLCVE
jgi:peptide methionine sulfoxide reductase MsrA